MNMHLVRAGILGDIHAEDQRLASALSYLTPMELDGIVCVGDIVDGRGDADRCCSLLMNHGVHCVRGNHDRLWSLGTPMGFDDDTPLDALSPEAVRWLASVPACRTFETPLGHLLLCHGLGE